MRQIFEIYFCEVGDGVGFLRIAEVGTFGVGTAGGGFWG